VVPSDRQHQVLACTLRGLEVVEAEPKRRLNMERIKLARVRDGLLAELNRVAPPAAGNYEQWAKNVAKAAERKLGRARAGTKLTQAKCAWWDDDLTAMRKTKKRQARRRFEAKNDEKFARASEALKLAKRGLTRAVYKAQAKHGRGLKEDLNLTADGRDQGFRMLKRASLAGSSSCAHSQKTMDNAWRPIVGEDPPASCGAAEAKSHIDDMEWDFALDESERVTLHEIKAAIKSLTRRKAAGVDEIANELLKVLPDEHLEFLCGEFNRILSDPAGQIPSSWLTSLVAMIPKTPDPDPTQFRPITLLSHVAKLLEKILHLRMADMPGTDLHADQFGFRTGLSGLDQVWRLKLASDWMRAHKTEGLAVFLDLKKAYDCVPADILVKKLVEKGLPLYFVRFCKAWVVGHVRRLMVGPLEEAEELKVNRGVPQGSILAPFLFNCFIDDLLQQIDNANPGIKIETKELSLDEGNQCWETEANTLGYADDIEFTCADATQVNTLLEVCTTWATRNGMTFAAKKCEVLSIGAPAAVQESVPMCMGAVELKTVGSFVYLGLELLASGDKRRIPRSLPKIEKDADRWSFQLGALHGCPIAVGRMLTNAIVFPRALYGAEVVDMNAPEITSSVAMMGRAILTCYRNDSKTKIFKYLGWPPIKDMLLIRRIAFFFRLLQSGSPQVQRDMQCYINDVKEDAGGAVVPRLKWFKSTWAMLRTAMLRNWIPAFTYSGLRASYANVAWVQGLQKQFLASAKAAMPTLNRVAELAPHFGYHSFIFFRGHFNPNDELKEIRDGDRAVVKCYFCEEKEDTVEHVLECEEKTISSIRDEFAAKIGAQDNPQLVYRLLHMLDSATSSASVTVCTALAETHMRIWRARRSRRERRMLARA
jgi:hypothetical protein